MNSLMSMKLMKVQETCFLVGEFERAKPSQVPPAFGSLLPFGLRPSSIGAAGVAPIHDFGLRPSSIGAACVAPIHDFGLRPSSIGAACVAPIHDFGLRPSSIGA
jgi:hypothetical protein